MQNEKEQHFIFPNTLILQAKWFQVCYKLHDGWGEFKADI